MRRLPHEWKFGLSRNRDNRCRIAEPVKDKTKVAPRLKNRPYYTSICSCDKGGFCFGIPQEIHLNRRRHRLFLFFHTMEVFMWDLDSIVSANAKETGTAMNTHSRSGTTRRATGRGVVWGGGNQQSHSSLGPAITFLGHGALESYIGLIHAAALDAAVTRPLNATLLAMGTATTSEKSLLVLGPGCASPDSPQYNHEKNALIAADACCLVVNRVQDIAGAGHLGETLRKKVRMIIFRGQKTDVVVKVIGILFPHLGNFSSIFAPETEDIPRLIRRIADDLT